MTDRRKFLKSTLLPAGALCLPSMLMASDGIEDPRRTNAGTGDQPPPDQPPPAPGPAQPVASPGLLSQKLRTLTRGSIWTLISQIKIRFQTFHCQGMVRIGDEFWVSSVEVFQKEDGTPDRNRGKGHLFRISAGGALIADIAIGEGSIFHPSGIDYDGTHIWIAAAEYRPDSKAIIYRFDVAQSKLEEVFRWDDHVGGVARDKETNTLHGISWGSRRFYKWPLDKEGRAPKPLPNPADAATDNPSFYIDYQDNQCLGGGEMLYTGLNVYRKPGGASFALGGLEIVDLAKGSAVHQVPVQLWSPATGAIMTQNPSFFELLPDQRLRAYFMPDDNDSTLFVYEA